MKEFIIGPNDAGQRFDKYLFKLLKNAGSGLIFKQLRNKNIVLNNHKSKGNEILNENDVVKVFMSDDTIAKFMGMDSASNNIPWDKLNIIYVDDNVILADKPAGTLSQKAKPDDVSMNEYLTAYWEKVRSGNEATFRPAFCNRLDRNTSGLMIGGMSLKGLQMMSEIIKNRTVDKYYLAIVKGRIVDNKVLKGYLYKDEKNNEVIIKDYEFNNSSEIHTEYSPVWVKDNMSLIMVRLITGKTHQIRAHLSHIGHPILGDSKYGEVGFNKQNNAKYQLLHSYKVVFPALSGELSNISLKSFCTDYPQSFQKYFPYNEVKEEL